MKTKKVAVASLIEDFDLYPRNRVDDGHVGDLVRAVNSGEELPPIVVDEKTMRIVDGFHRRRAYLRAVGEEAMAVVDLRRYKNDAEAFLDAVALNSAHGRKLDRHDQTRIVLKLRELHVPDNQIAVTLHVPEPTVQQLSMRIVMVQAGVRPFKRGLEHMRGQTLSNEQMAVVDSVRSAEAGRLSLELTRLLDAGLVDLTDPQIVERLTILRRQIDLALKTVRKAG